MVLGGEREVDDVHLKDKLCKVKMSAKLLR